MPPVPDAFSDTAHLPDSLPETLRAGFEWLPVGVLMSSAQGVIVLVNHALEKISGYPAAELIGQPVDVLIPDAMRGRHSSFLADFMRQPRARAMGEGREIFARRKDGSEVPVEVGLTPMVIAERAFVLAAVVDVSERQRAQAELRTALNERIDFEVLVAELAAQFVHLRPEEVDRAIEEALGRLVRALDLDRSALFQLIEDTGDFVHTHQWTRPGWASPPPRISARERFPWHLARIREGELVIYGSAEQVPDPVDRESLRELGTRSNVTIPLVTGNRTWGAVTFATVGRSRMWTPEIVNRLRVVAMIFANVLTRKQSDERLRQIMAENASLRARLRDENAYLRREVNALLGAPAIVGHSAGIRRALEQVRQAAATAAPVLLVGETGTGKSLLASRIHELSDRRDHAMVRVNCASLLVTSVERDLFGRSQNTLLGGDSPHVGLLELAEGSTVFLDEITNLPLDTQASLARVLQHDHIRPRGHGRPIKVNLRIIAATRRDLLTHVQEGKFREDLYYQLNVMPIHIPPLRERAEDIPLLVWRFVDEFAATYGTTVDAIDQESMALLQAYDWPGNARELRNVVERAMIVAKGRRLSITPQPPANVKRGRETLAAVEKAHIVAVLDACGGKIGGPHGAAAQLGLSPRALDAKLAKLGIRRQGVAKQQRSRSG
jgi:formate hydrogenlyase transcriptional activator